MYFDKLKYSKIGNGKNVVVILHGWGADSKTFLQGVKNLGNCTCYLVDLYGFGQTPISRNMDTYEYAIQLYLFFVSKKLNNFTLVGHSFGGRISIILASMFDIKIKNIVLVSSAGLKPRFNLLTRLKVLSYKIVKYLANKNVINSNVLKKFGSKDLQSAQSYLKISFVKIVNQHLDYLVPKITLPALIAWGTKDKTTPKYMAKRFVKLLPKSRVVFYNSNHFCYLNNVDFWCKLNDWVYGGII